MPPKRTPQSGGTSDPDDPATSGRLPSPSSGAIAALSSSIDARFHAIDLTLNRMIARLDSMDTRLAANESALNDVATRLDKIEQRERTVERPKASFSEKSPELIEDIYGQTEQLEETTPQPPPETAVVVGKIQKIPADILVPFNPDEGATAKYCDNLCRLTIMYGEPSVIAAIPQTLKGRALDWFNSNTMDMARMRTVEGWIDTLKEEFKVNIAVARKAAQERKYDPDADASVLDYYWNKVNLVKSASPEMLVPEIIDEVWLGLPPEFQVLLNSRELRTLNTNQVGLLLQDKDWPFHAAWKKQQRHRNHDRTSRKSDIRKEVEVTESDSSSSHVHMNEMKTRKDKDKTKPSLDPSDRQNPIPEPLPQEKWRTDKKVER